MPFDEALADRVRGMVARQAGVKERKMFGGLSFMVAGNMFCGVIKNELMVRVGPERYAAALDQPGARPMDFTGRAIAHGVAKPDLKKFIDLLNDGRNFHAQTQQQLPHFLGGRRSKDHFLAKIARRVDVGDILPDDLQGLNEGL